MSMVPGPQGGVDAVLKSEKKKNEQPANPDTTAATLANLEIEVNQIKAALRAAGILAP